MRVPRACVPRLTAAYSDRSGTGTGGYERRSRSRDPGRWPAWPPTRAASDTAGCMPAGSGTRRAARGFRSCVTRAVPVARAQPMAAPRPEARAWAGRVSGALVAEHTCLRQSHLTVNPHRQPSFQPITVRMAPALKLTIRNRFPIPSYPRTAPARPLYRFGHFTAGFRPFRYPRPASQRRCHDSSSSASVLSHVIVYESAGLSCPRPRCSSSRGNPHTGGFETRPYKSSRLAHNKKSCASL